MPKFYFPLFLSILFYSCGNNFTEVKYDTLKAVPHMKAHPKESFKMGLTDAIEIIKGNRTPYDEGFARSGDSLYYCSYKGKVELSDTMRKKRILLFDLKSEFMVDRIFIIPITGKGWMVSWQETDHEGVKSYAAVFKTGMEKPEWKLRFLVPNPGIPVLDGQDVYVTYLGTVAKISTEDGKIKWKYDSLFNTTNQPFKKIDRPRVFDNRVEFVDFPIEGRRQKRDTLRVDPVSGERLK